MAVGHPYLRRARRHLHTCETMPNLVVGIEICEDLWAAEPPAQEALVCSSRFFRPRAAMVMISRHRPPRRDSSDGMKGVWAGTAKGF